LKSPSFETTDDSAVTEKTFPTTTISSLDEEQTEKTTTIAVIESVDLDSETIETTNAPEISTLNENSDAEEMTDTVTEGEKEEDDNKIPQSLLNAVSDLLSSVLGISYSDDDDDESEKEQELAQQHQGEMTENNGNCN
jgi:hypothetical protein